MMRKYILFALIIFVGFTKSFANHASSGEVFYRHLKNMEYEVTMVAYRDCRGIPIPSQDLLIYNDSFSVSTKTTRIKIEDILTDCASKPCTPANTTIANLGLEAHYFVDTIDFNSGIFQKFISKNYCTVYFAYNTCCRTSLSNGYMFVEAMLNLCIAKNQSISSPKFINPIAFAVSCNQPFSYSFYTGAPDNGDSIVYEQAKPKNAYNAYESYGGSYSEKIPMTPYCLPPGVINCTPNTVTEPFKGYYFNPKNGNILFTPTNCSEVSTIVCQINVFRKDSGKYKLVCYIKRDMLIVIKKSGRNKPTLSTYKDYTIKARENVCFDIKVKDDTTKTSKDTVKLFVKEFPRYGKLSLVDSNAREKTLHFCWNVSDSDYIKRKEANVTIYAYDSPCDALQSMSTTINFKVVAPDSFTNIIVKTYYDKNKNGKKDVGEPYQSAEVSSFSNKIFTTYNTDVNGLLTIKALYGKFILGINRSQFIYSTGKDSLLLAKFDSTHVLEFGFYNNQGIKGKVFEDLNNNCSYDAGIDVLLNGIKIIDKSNNAVAFTDNNGYYLLNNVPGTYILMIDSNLLYEGTCITQHTVNIVKDSQFSSYDFPVRRKPGFKDISISLTPLQHIRNNAKMTQQIVLENKGNVKVSSFYVKLLPSKKLFQFTSPLTTFKNKDTILWLIDSVSKGTKKTIDFSHFIMKDSFNNGDQITYQVWVALKDNVAANNYFKLTETVRDSGCCSAQKTVYAPNRYYPMDKTITYRLNFTNPMPAAGRVFITDTLDDNRFDLKSLQIVSKTTNTIAYLSKNVLNLDLLINGSSTNAEIIYSLDLKTPLTDSFSIYNKAECIFDYQSAIKSNTVVTKIASPIEYTSLSKFNFCEKEKMMLKIKTLYKPESNNHFKVYLSDSLGNFSQPSLLLDTAANSETNELSFILPKVPNRHLYKIKVTGSNPALEAFSSAIPPPFYLNPLPTISYTSNIINNNICKNDTIKLNAKGAATYQFVRNNINMGSFSANPDYQDVVTGFTDYNIRFKSVDGCINTSPYITPIVLSLPKVVLKTSDSVLCDGELLNFNLSGAKTFTLFKNSTTIVASAITAISYQLFPPLNQTFYHLSGTDVNGCRNLSNTVKIVVNPLAPKPVITKVNKALKSSYANSNQWYNQNTKIDSAMGQYFYPNTDGQYLVLYTDSNGCGVLSDIYNLTGSGLYPIVNLSLFKIYPNPAQHFITIENQTGEVYDYELFDSYGRLLLSGTGNELNTIDIKQLNSGNYALKIKTGYQVAHFKIIVIQ